MAEAAENLDSGTTIILPGDGAAAAAGPAAGVEDDPEKRFADLRQQLDGAQAREKAANERAAAEAKRRAESDKVARDATQREREANSQAADAEYDSVINALSRVKGEMEGLEAQHAAALESGEFAKASKLQSQMSVSGARLVQLEDGKAQLEDRRETAKRQPQERQPQGQQQVTRTPTEEQELFLASIPPASAAWVRAHPQYFTDASFRAKVNGTAGYLESVRGITVDGKPDEYFREIEEAVGLRAPGAIAAATRAAPDAVSTAGAAVIDRASATAAAAAAPRPVPAAAPSRTVPTGVVANADGTRGVSLSAEERAHARLTMTPDIIGKDPKTGLPRDPEIAFAEQKARLIAEGKWFS